MRKQRGNILERESESEKRNVEWSAMVRLEKEGVQYLIPRPVTEIRKEK